MPKTRPRPTSSLARLAVAALVDVLLACTATVVSVQAAAVAPQLAAPMQKLTIGQDQHSAFPGITREPSGTLRLVWRQGTNHMSGDGRIMTAESWDDGQTWHNTQTLRANPDYRDPSIASIDGISYMTWFGAQPGNSAMGAGMMRAWQVESRRIDPANHPAGAISAPLVKLPDGRIGAAFYGKKPGESRWTAWMAWSSDNGWTWSSNRIVNEAGMDTAEPYLVVNGSTTHMLVRWGNDAIGIRTSPDSGVSWAPPRKILDNATGRPTTIATAGGMLVMVYREASTGAAAMAYSVDNGANWAQAGTVLPPPLGGGQMTYAAMERAAGEPDEIRLIVGMEDAAGVKSQLYGGTVVMP